LRIRREGARAIQTVKTTETVDRGEWERQSPNGEPSLGDTEADGVAKRLKRRMGLRPIFSLQVNRRICTLSSGGSEIEVALDEGKLEAHGREARIHEVELELKSGDSAELYRLAEKITRETAATPCLAGKGARGYRLADGVAGTPARGLELHIADDVSVSDAFQKICDACLKQFSLNEDILQSTLDSEAVHQARVAIRRLRAAFSMFKTLVVGADADAMRRELKWLSDLLGEVRDIDVFLETRVKEIALQHPNVAGVAELASRLEETRERARGRLEDGLQSERFRALLLGVARCVHDGEWPKRDDLFVDFANSELKRRLRAVQKRRKAVGASDALKRHRLRIAAKKLRYMVEFAKPIVSNKSLAAAADRLEQLQDLLGELNDAIAGERLLAHAVSEPPQPGLGFAADLVRATIASSPKHTRKAIKTHDELRDLHPFR
jgi:triphosphatase